MAVIFLHWHGCLCACDREFKVKLLLLFFFFCFLLYRSGKGQEGEISFVRTPVTSGRVRLCVSVLCGKQKKKR